MIFDRVDSYNYQGIVYLAFKWEADIGYNSVPNAGTPDKIVILIPWEIKKTTGYCQPETPWCQLMQDDDPSVYVEAPNGDSISVHIVEGLSIEKRIEGVKFRFKEVIVEVPENIVNTGTIYIGFRLATCFYGSNSHLSCRMSIHGSGLARELLMPF